MATVCTALVVIVIALQWAHLSLRQRGNDRTHANLYEYQVVLLAVSFMAAMVLCGVAIATGRTVSTPVALGAFVLAVIGAGIRIAAIERIGRGFSWGSKAPDELITNGIYRLVKHPLIVGYVLETAGLTLVGVGPAWLKSAVVVTVIFAAAVQVRKEERILHTTFGEQWVVFARRKLF